MDIKSFSQTMVAPGLSGVGSTWVAVATEGFVVGPAVPAPGVVSGEGAVVGTGPVGVSGSGVWVAREKKVKAIIATAATLAKIISDCCRSGGNVLTRLRIGLVQVIVRVSPEVSQPRFDSRA